MNLDHALETLYNREKLTEKEVKELCERVSWSARMQRKIDSPVFAFLYMTTIGCIFNSIFLILTPTTQQLLFSLFSLFSFIYYRQKKFSQKKAMYKMCEHLLQFVETFMVNFMT
jgi:hypothetical protein